jgi:hypothetical protein
VPGRHRHAADVRTDGLAAVLGRLLDHPAVRSAALVDVDSGMLLDTAGDRDATGPIGDPEVLGALHADLVRAAAGLLPPSGNGLDGAGPDGAGPDGALLDGDVLVDSGPSGHHVVRILTDPHGGRLALTAVVVGPWWVVERVRRRLRRVPAEALTAGPVRVAQAWGPGQRVVRADVARAPVPPPAAVPRPGAARTGAARTGAAAPVAAGRAVAGPPPAPVPAARRPAAPGPPPVPPPGSPLVPPPTPVPPRALRVAPPPVPVAPLPRRGDRPAEPRPAPVPAGPAMALLPRVDERPASPPAAALEAPAPVVRRLRPVDPRAAARPAAPPSALPPAPPGAGPER